MTLTFADLLAIVGIVAGLVLAVGGGSLAWIRADIRGLDRRLGAETALINGLGRISAALIDGLAPTSAALIKSLVPTSAALINDLAPRSRACALT